MKNMRISAFLMPLFALLAGVSGFYLRLMEIWNVFDDRTGLPERGAGITYALIALSAVFLFVIFLFALHTGSKYTSPSGFENAFGTESLAYPFCFLVIGLVWLGSTVKHFIDINAAGSIPFAEVSFSILSALSAISVFLFSVEVFQDPRRKTKLVLSVVPILFICFWLILLYRRNASNPILLSYCYQCLAIISSALGFYFTSGYVHNRPTPGRIVFSFFAAIYFCFVTLADNHTISIKLIFTMLIATNAIYSSMLLRNMQRKR